MNFETFELERIQSLYENTVQYNLTESGIHPYTARELVSEAEIDAMLEPETGLRPNQRVHRTAKGHRPALPGGWHGQRPCDQRVGRSRISRLPGATSRPGDEVVVMLPNYMQIWEVATQLGA